MSVLDNIMLGRHVHMRPSALASLFYWVWALREELTNRKIVEEIIEFMQLQDIRDEPVEVIPMGLQKRVELARALAAQPRFLILDEPMAGMNQEEKEYIARFILDAREERDVTILIIEHYMDVVTAICDRIVVLSYGTVIGDNRPRLYFAMLAAGVLRAFPVPVFPDVSANELATYTLHGLPTMAVAEDQEQVDKLIELRERIGRPTTIVYDDDRGLRTYTGAGIVSFDTVIASGLRRLAAEPRP